jgi:GMP synthase (glutamine-hydrolysing)
VTKSIVILQVGDPALPVAARRGPFADWITHGIGAAWTGEYRVHDARTDAPLPSATDAAAFVITGSSSSVLERAPWMLRLGGLVRACAEAETPLLGICFGHQIVATALGGEVTRNPRGREIGTVRVRRLADDAIFVGAPEVFDANATHVDCVARLPDGASLLASSDLDPTQAFAFGRAIRCVQFHPEMDGDAMRAYVSARADRIEAEGGDPSAILERAIDAPYAQGMLGAFVRGFVRPEQSPSALRFRGPTAPSPIVERPSPIVERPSRALGRPTKS